MNSVKHILFLIGVFCCFHAAIASIEGAHATANFLDGKVMLIEEHVKFNENIFRDSSENETHTKYKAVMFGENQHALVYFSAFNPEKGKNEE